GEVDGAGPRAAKEDFLPGTSAIAGAIEPALLVRSPRVPQRRDVDQVGVVRVDADLGDVPRVGQAHVSPRLAAVGRLVDAVAVRDVAADARLTCAGIDDVG